MRLPTLLDPEAELEWLEASNWYESKDPGRGADFDAAVERALDHIEQWPTLHPCVFEDIRMYQMEGYPYALYFVVESAFIQVISVFHNRRNPRDWQKRR